MLRSRSLVQAALDARWGGRAAVDAIAPVTVIVDEAGRPLSTIVTSPPVQQQPDQPVDEETS